jgi:hypothetical protein
MRETDRPEEDSLYFILTYLDIIILRIIDSRDMGRPVAKHTIGVLCANEEHVQCLIVFTDGQLT